MKAKMKEIKEAVNAVAATKNDMILKINHETGMGLFVSTDAQIGIKIMSVFSVSEVEEDETFYLSNTVKESINSLSNFGEIAELKRCNNELEVKAGDGKIKVGIIDEEPIDIEETDPDVICQISGQEFIYAMNQISFAPQNRLYVSKNKIDMYGIARTRMCKTTLPVRQYQEENEIEGVCNIGIVPEAWKKVSSICKNEYLCLYVSPKHVKLVWRNLVVMLPLSIKEVPTSFEKKFEAVVAANNSTVFSADAGVLINALNLATLGGKKEVVFRGEGKKEVEVYTATGNAKIKTPENVDAFCNMYNGGELKNFLSMNKNVKYTLMITDEKLWIIKLEEKFNHCLLKDDGEEENVKNKIEVLFLTTPIIKES